MKKLLLNLIKAFALVASTFYFTGCASVPRNKTTDPIMRIAIDSDSITQGSYARLENALHKNGSWIVVDRSAGFRAISNEQQLEHKGAPERFAAAEKYSQWGSLYGVGGIVIATQQCNLNAGFLGRQYFRCLENLALINATTGEVMASAEVSMDTDNQGTAPAWEEAVDQLTGNYPRRMIDEKNPNLTVEYNKHLKAYRDENERKYGK